MESIQTTLQGAWERTVDAASGYLPSLLGALAILIVGWLVALGIAGLIRAGLRRTQVDNRIASWLWGEGKEAPNVERGTARAVFWLIMLFVLIAFFQVLKLAAVTEPLERFVEEIFAYAPRLLSAGLLLLLAWLVGTVLRRLVRAVLERVRLDERIGGAAEAEEAERPAVTRMISETVYWLVLLLFLPAILGALALDGLLGPVRSILDEVLAFLPNLFAAAIVLVLGLFVARIIQRVVAGLAASVGADGLGERVGLGGVLGKQKLSGLLGLVVYVLILVPVVIAALNALDVEAITRPASSMLDRMLAVLPALFGAALVLAIAYVVGRLVGGLVANLLRAGGFDGFLARIGLAWKAGKDGGSEVAGQLVVVAVMLFAAIEASRLLGFAALAGLITTFTVFLGDVLLGLAILAIGLYLGKLAADTIRASQASQAWALAPAAWGAIVVLAAAMALRQMGVAQDIVNLAFGLLLGSVAVAAAIAFGVGGRDLARQELDRWAGALRSGPKPGRRPGDP